jgi:PAS domain S-box-containing protein
MDPFTSVVGVLKRERWITLVMESTELTTSLRETLDVVEATGDAYEPLTTNEVTERLDVGRRSTYERLKRLVDQERLRTKKVGARGRVWWRPPPAKAASETGDGAQRPPVRPNVEFRALVDTVEEYAIFQFDEEGYIRTWNPGAEHVKGYEPKEIIGEHFSTFYTEDAVAEGVPGKTLEAAAAEGEIVNEGWRVRADGSRFWANVTITAIRDDDGELLGFAMVTRDMTERREREQQLRRERDLIERVLDTVPVGVGVASSEGEILRVNERSTDLLGIVDDDGAYDPNEYKLYDTDGSPISQEEQPVTRVVETGNAVREQQCQIEHSDGERRWLSVHAAPLEDEDGQVDRVVVVGEDISPLREQANRLERQRDDLETELAEVFDRVDDAFYAIDEEWRFTHVNDRGEEFLGRTEGELLGRVVWEVFPEAKGTMGEEAFRRAVKTQESVTYEECFEPLDRWFEVRAYPSESGLSVYFRDITERKQRERELERYEQLVETVWDGVAALDDDDRFTMVNDAFCEMAGYDREELLGEPVTRIHSEDVNEEAAELNEEVQRGERDVATLEFQLLTADGETVPVEGRFGPYKHGDTSGRVGVVRDITERKQYERELEEAERRYRTLVENYPNGAIILFDEDLEYLIAGGEAFEGLDVSIEDLEGDTIPEHLPAEFTDTFEPRFRAVFEGQVSEFEFEFNDQIRQFQVVPVRDGSGSIFAGLTISQDVTQHREHERELKRQREQLEAVNNLNGVVQDITDAVVAQSTREEIEDAVVGGLADAESFSFAWIGEVDVVTREVELRTEAGVDGYLEGVTITTDPDDERSNGPTAQALLTGEPQVAQDVQTNPGHDPWRDHIEAYDIRSSAAIPIVHEGATHGVLNVYADRPYAFDDTERQVLTQLGEVVGHAIAAVERKQALMSDEVVELEFRIPGVFQALEIEASSEGQITHDQAVPTGDGSYLLYGTATDDAWPAVGSIIDAVPHWESVQDLGQRGDRHRFEVTLTEPPVLSVVASRGGYVQEAVIEDGDYHMTVHLPPTVDNRSIAEAVEDAYPMADLVAQRQFSRTDDTRARFERLLHEELTERQRAAVEVAFHAGFFEWPRESDGEAVSESLGVSPPTFHQHLRKAERKVFEAFLKGRCYPTKR